MRGVVRRQAPRPEGARKWRQSTSWRRALGATSLAFAFFARSFVAFTSTTPRPTPSPRPSSWNWSGRRPQVRRAVVGGEAELGSALATAAVAAPLPDPAAWSFQVGEPHNYDPLAQGFVDAFSRVDVGILGIQFFAVLFASCFGFGDAVLAIPLLALLMHVEASQAAPLVIAVSVMLSIFTVGVDYADGSMTKSGRWSESGMLVVAAAVGVPCGVQALLFVDPLIIRSIVGMLLIMYGGWSAFGSHKTTGTSSNSSRGNSSSSSSSSSSGGSSTYVASEGGGADLAVAAVMAGSRGTARAPMGGTFAALPVGFMAGLLGGAVAEFGPPIVVYGTWQRWSPTTMRTMLARFFLPLNVYALGNFAAAGLWSNTMLAQVVATIPAVVVAVALGTAFNRRVDTKEFSQVLYVSIICLGFLCLYSVLNP